MSSISDIKKRGWIWPNRKTVIAFLAASIIAIAINNIYAIFGHGVISNAMRTMFLYPLIGGTVFYFILGLLVPGINEYKGYRVFFNIYNSGLAVLTVGSFLNGILEIAGTDSPYVQVFYGVGWAFIIIGMLLLMLIRDEKELS